MDMKYGPLGWLLNAVLVTGEHMGENWVPETS